LHNPAFIIRNWGDKQAKVNVQGSNKKPEEIRQANEYGLEDNTLVLWLKMNLSEEVGFSISPIR